MKSPSRLTNIYEDLELNRIDALFVSSAANISYLTEFQSRDSYLLISKKKTVYFTDSRYTLEAKQKLNNRFEICQISAKAISTIAGVCNKMNLKKIGIEEKNLNVALFNSYKKELRGKTRLIPVRNLIESHREIKDENELKNIRKATNITLKAFNFIKNFIKPGRKELEIAAELERFIRYEGASNSSFDIIVASGPNSSFPHHISSQRKIRENEPVLIDMGVDFKGYKSDLTRVFFSGKMLPLQRKIYETVEAAQKAAILKIKPGIPAKEIDATARQYITEKGFGGNFSHSTGHGIGLEIHEEPNISPNNASLLHEGMVFTVEPGIYLAGKFGIRIEDTIIINNRKVEVISSGSIN